MALQIRSKAVQKVGGEINVDLEVSIAPNELGGRGSVATMVHEKDWARLATAAKV